MDDQTQRYIDNLEKHKIQSKEKQTYSIRRFDVLIITLSSGALVFSMGFINDLITNISSSNTTLIKLSWLSYGISIVINLLSQVTGYIANKYEIRITQNIIREKRGKKLKGNQKFFEKIKKTSNTLTIAFNITSLVTFITGIALMIIYIFKNF